MKFPRRLLPVIVSLLSIFAVSQTQPQQSQAPPDKATATATKEDTHLSPAEADELFKSLDDIMKFASEDSGLPIKAPIKRELGDRDEVVKYIQKKMEEDEDTKRFERTELVLKKFGMLPLDFQLKPFLLKLLREQVAGFYDSKTKTMHMLDWVPADQQRPVMAHELTHALQDQMVDLEKWTGLLTDSAKNAVDPVNAEIEDDEDSTARTALVEGQGTVVMVDYILLPMGKSVENSPELANVMKQSMNSTEGMSVLASAPVLLRESLTFPYRDGLGFVQALLKSGGKKKAFAEALKDPPHDTHQILHPQDYLAHKPTPVMHMPDLSSALGQNYEKYDVGSIGEFDLSILFQQFDDQRSAKELSPQWNGGMYFSAVKRANKSANGSTAETKSPADLSVLYVSHWLTPESAAAFAKAYGDTVVKRYGASAVRKACAGTVDCSMWNTAPGPVSIQTMGNSVIVIESFDEKTAEALRKLVSVSNAAPTKTVVAIPPSSLSLRLTVPFFAARRTLRVGAPAAAH